jgi:hypothetical protein
VDGRGCLLAALEELHGALMGLGGLARLERARFLRLPVFGFFFRE